MPISALLIHGVPVECINQAALTYYVPAKTIIAVLETEGGEVGMASPNKNGTFDYGPMQINSLWLKTIAAYGYTKEQVQYDPCINVQVGAWILSREIAAGKDYWQGVGSYHSHTLWLNQDYQQKVQARLHVLNRYLAQAGVL
jgi:hypothetical protein